MAPDVVVRKLAYLRALLADLARHAGATIGEIEEDPYRVERLLELLVTAAADLLAHLLAERGEPPATYRETFRRAGDLGLVEPHLAERLERAAGMRNVLVHLYEDVDYEIVQQAIGDVLRDFPKLIAQLESHGGRA